MYINAHVCVYLKPLTGGRVCFGAQLLQEAAASFHKKGEKKLRILFLTNTDKNVCPFAKPRPSDSFFFYAGKLSLQLHSWWHIKVDVSAMLQCINI